MNYDAAATQEWDLYDQAPAWRWDLAVAYSDEFRTPTRSSDPEVRAAWKFLAKWRECTSKVDKFNLRTIFPDLMPAYLMYVNPLSAKWLLEAGLLSGASVEDLSKFTGCPQPVIRKYGQLFYDIEEKRSARGYVISRVLMPAIQRGVDSRDYDFFMKSLAYFAGWKILVAFLSDELMDSEARAFFSDNFVDRMLKLGYVATHKLEINNYTATEVIDHCIKLRDLERAQGTPANQTEAWRILESLLQRCATTVTPATQRTLTAHEARVLEHQALPALKFGDKIPIEVGGGHGKA